jgi:hypothetical protein
VLQVGAIEMEEEKNKNKNVNYSVLNHKPRGSILNHINVFQGRRSV